MGAYKGITNPDKTNSLKIRDTFQTPNYAVDLLVPFIPANRIAWTWEPACGDGKIVKRLLANSDLDVFASDIKQSKVFSHAIYDFVGGEFDGTIPMELWEWFQMGGGSIITNPPFSLKKKFIEKAFMFNVPFAMLVGAEYSGQMIDWVQRGCEKVIPTSRISYITPNIVERINIGENMGYGSSVYHTVDEIPQDLLYKYSSAQFHSLWLTYGFGLGRTETFVELTPEMKKGNI